MKTIGEPQISEFLMISIALDAKKPFLMVAQTGKGNSILEIYSKK